MVKRRTKILATVGPSIIDRNMLLQCVLAGVDIFRLNMSHGNHDTHLDTIKNINDISIKLQKNVGILVDLQGPKIRIAKFKDKKIFLEVGQHFILDANHPSENGDNNVVGLDYKDLPQDLSINDTLLLDDGRVTLKVNEIDGSKIDTTVILGGTLSNNKGINRQGGGLTAKALTAKDKEDIKFLKNKNIDYVALSFPRDKEDIIYARNLLNESNVTASLIAKIERVEAVENLEEIIDASDGVMVARGDLGVEIGYAELPAVQKKMIQMARDRNRAVITATQMMESMIDNPIPTRAEVTDVANAVFQGTDSVMLSAETASGNYPIAVVEHMSQVCLAAERQRETQVSYHRLDVMFERSDEAIAMAAMYTANHLKVGAIVSLTESGFTPFLMSRIRSGIPIYGVSGNNQALGKMTLYRGVYPVDYNFSTMDSKEAVAQILSHLKEIGYLKQNCRVIVTMGDEIGVAGNSNIMKIVDI